MKTVLPFVLCASLAACAADETIAATKRACPDLAQEATLFEALSAVNTADVLGDTMILTAVTDGETTAQMVLEAR